VIVGYSSLCQIVSRKPIQAHPLPGASWLLPVINPDWCIMEMELKSQALRHCQLCFVPRGLA
jgi:hypothetical protein